MICPKCKVDGWIALHNMNTGVMCWRCAIDDIVTNNAFKIEELEKK